MMKRLLADIPRNVVTAVTVLLFVGTTAIILFFTLGAAATNAIALNAQLLRDIQQANSLNSQTATDIQYVKENVQQYESLLNGDRLIPHTRRVAVLELQRVAREHGLTALNYKFTAAAADSPRLAQERAQAATDAYRLSVEDIDLMVGAATDGAIYRFVRDITDAFPGAIVLQSLSLSRASAISDEALTAVSRGVDSRLVSGNVRVTWRTAQAQEGTVTTTQGGGR